MYKIVFATGNAGKLREIRQILSDTGMEILSMKEAGLDPEIEETGTSFAENALIKARIVAATLQTAATQTPGLPAAASEEPVERKSAAERSACAMPDPAETIVLADDSGLEIDYLDGAPGIYSARYLGEQTSYEVKNADLIGRLAGVPDAGRTARFVCAIAAVLPDGGILQTQGTIEGQIGHEARGTNGFGYDPIFWLPERGMTSAELSPGEKDAVSHRGKALRAMKEKLTARLGL